MKTLFVIIALFFSTLSFGKYMTLPDSLIKIYQENRQSYASYEKVIYHLDLTYTLMKQIDPTQNISWSNLVDKAYQEADKEYNFLKDLAWKVLDCKELSPDERWSINKKYSDLYFELDQVRHDIGTARDSYNIKQKN